MRDTAYELILLDPTTVTLFRTGGDSVRATIVDPQLGPERSYLRVQVARAFPLLRPNEYIGLRDASDKDIGMLRTLDGMDATSVTLIQEELTRRYFIPKVLSIVGVREELGTTTWDVETDRGRRQFVVPNMREAMYEVSPGRYLLTDKDGVRYEFDNIVDLETIGPAARGRRFFGGGGR